MVLALHCISSEMTEKKVYELTVDPEFRDLIPPLNEEELKLLEESLAADGCESPLIVWNSVIIDGHNRYAICRKHDIPFSIQEKNFDTREEVMLWMLRNQLGRRNLNNYQRSELALKFEPLFAHASEKRMLAGKLVDPPQNSAEGSGETRKQIAKMAGVSHDTIKKVKRLHEHADEETKSRLRRGEMTVNKAYNELCRRSTKAKPKSVIAAERRNPLLLSLFHPTVTAFLRSAGNAKRRSALQAKTQRKQWPRTPQNRARFPAW